MALGGNTNNVATVPTVYGIETFFQLWEENNQCLLLQQYLPFTVLKLKNEFLFGRALLVATVPTVYGIETIQIIIKLLFASCLSCNSTYRLRY